MKNNDVHLATSKTSVPLLTVRLFCQIQCTVNLWMKWPTRIFLYWIIHKKPWTTLEKGKPAYLVGSPATATYKINLKALSFRISVNSIYSRHIRSPTREIWGAVLVADDASWIADKTPSQAPRSIYRDRTSKQFLKACECSRSRKRNMTAGSL